MMEKGSCGGQDQATLLLNSPFLTFSPILSSSRREHRQLFLLIGPEKHRASGKGSSECVKEHPGCREWGKGLEGRRSNWCLEEEEEEKLEPTFDRK